MTYLIYQIHCKITDKLYVGLTSKGLHQRWTMHNYMKKSNYAIHNAINKYGKDAFTLRILKSNLTKKEAVHWEKYFIAKKNTLSPNGYNLTKGGDGVSGCEETNQKIGIKNKKRFSDPMVRKMQSKIALIQWKNPEFREKMNEGMKKRWENPVTKANYLKGLQSKEYREVAKQRALKQWADPVFRNKMEQARINNKKEVYNEY